MDGTGLGADWRQIVREAHGEMGARYRGWSEAQAAERERNRVLRAVEGERESRRMRIERYISFFERAHHGSRTALDWWLAYHEDEESDDEQPISGALGSALARAEAGIARFRELEEPLKKLLVEDSFGEADRLLDELVEGQEELDGEDSVFPPLVAAHDRIRRLKGWATFREEMERFIRDLEDLLGSQKVRTAAANRARFPDPDKPRPPEASTIPPSAPALGGGWRNALARPPSTPINGGLLTGAGSGFGVFSEWLGRLGFWGLLALIVVAMLAILFLSPVLAVIGLIATVGSIILTMIKAANGKPWKGWAVLAITATFATILLNLYANGVESTNPEDQENAEVLLAALQSSPIVGGFGDDTVLDVSVSGEKATVVVSWWSPESAESVCESALTMAASAGTEAESNDYAGITEVSIKRTGVSWDAATCSWRA